MILYFLSVAVNAANMELFISTNPNASDTPLNLNDPLVEGREYFIDCVVKRATSIVYVTADLNGPVTETSRTYNELQTMKRFRFRADVATHNGQLLRCTAKNDGNVLLNDYNSSIPIDQTISAQVTVESIGEWKQGYYRMG